MLGITRFFSNRLYPLRIRKYACRNHSLLNFHRKSVFSAIASKLFLLHGFSAFLCAIARGKFIDALGGKCRGSQQLTGSNNP